MNKRPMGNFVFLDRTRYDLSSDLTILRCTLFSQISPQQKFAVESRLVDWKDILRWTVDDHNAAHQSDLAWLNDEVSTIAAQEPRRRIVGFTHHSPSIDPRCIDPKHANSEVSTGFATDLRQKTCWTNPIVAAWVFGHTHFNCCFRDGDKAILSNQMGHHLIPAKGFDATWVLTVERREGT
ncbi:hypothetical protein NUU61_001679 [Penicillium alfredii]|uniref:Calcineurin-like phosphoesterase domain-containing protein n=1 Tax=Penicillium alfredii TaxID=1506179 RepID=A0A9W9FQS3_9EURO|nr:uncharacterized protein NUU61_001679 [Penicillium alfredii]KAJ5104332.1 hypothetical protein NUU61_001679 [Penicillium alfredii]